MIYCQVTGAFDSAVSKKRKQTPPDFELGFISTTIMPYPELYSALIRHRVWFWICLNPKP